ncbi:MULTISPECIES: hypothetical protein [Streptomyces]|uniref:Uncharacterized protein n=1 Tax=Streptomyces caniscabiei TaxID=2746961 RepID=A0ABU4MYY9_9ACTN|nr:MULTISPECIES: hypothetical protein [Streptomyces]MDX2946616.1 hypothetical protein [Streptomyces caniscabiei]MDX2957174.1 hypothetical protein [Streptomyces caniscabiei]MDX2988921.1 hypothetical protein [Streptomyces caniscabiei]MDX3014004.1 hypothetical protein [Streptomyces caniscabiei]MDX3042745.1 hypothetical protein [Streptomyces caniscabiei]
MAWAGPGDRVLFEADEERWHGAVHWLNPVTDEEYTAVPATD